MSLKAHKVDQTYVYLSVRQDRMHGEFQINQKELNAQFGLNLKKRLSKAELIPHKEAIQNYLLDKVAFSSKLGDHPYRFDSIGIVKLNELPDFLKVYFTFDNIKDIPEEMDVKFEAFIEDDPVHQGLLLIKYNWKAGILDNESLSSLIFGPKLRKSQQKLDLTDGSIMKGVITMIQQGMWHIYIGLDHILFLVALLLPAVVRREAPIQSIKIERERKSKFLNFMERAGLAWIPVEKFKPAFFYIIKIVTFFTLAHSITLSLAALGWVSLSSRLVESIIAFSIGLAALHNITPILKGKEWMIAFGFGLFHGFGFASVLGEKGMEGDYLGYTLFGFNVGVEIGQILIICAIFPILFFLRKTRFYPKIITWGSVLLILISIYWCIERILDINIGISAPLVWLMKQF